MSYGSRHETSDLRTFIVPGGAECSHRRATLQRRLCSAPKPDTSGKFPRGVPTQKIAASLGCGSQTVRNAIHAFNERGLDALEPGSSRPKRTRAAFDEESAEQLREMLHRSPREFGRETSLWTLEMAAEVSFEEGLTGRRVSGETIRATLVRLLGVRWQRAKRWITSPDPLYERKKGGATD
jgi:transposase